MFFSRALKLLTIASFLTFEMWAYAELHAMPPGGLSSSTAGGVSQATISEVLPAGPVVNPNCECTTSPMADASSTFASSAGSCQVMCHCDEIEGEAPSTLCRSFNDLDPCPDSPSSNPGDEDYEPSIPNVTCEYDFSPGQPPTIVCRDNDNVIVCEDPFQEG